MSNFVKIRTRNFTARPLRRSILFDKPAIVRMGSRTPSEHVFREPKSFIEINTIEAIQNSRDKLRMKSCFAEVKIPQAEWWDNLKDVNLMELPYPIVVKRVCGFQGRGMRLLNNLKEFNNWIDLHKGDYSGWFFERFYNYAREYRLHVAKDIGIFMSWRKLRTSDAKERWFFNSSNCNWVGENNELFDKPKCWKKMEDAAIKALDSTGLDIGAVDIRVQSNKQKNNLKFIVCEINSAPSLGELGIEEYKKVIKQLLINKTNG